MGLLQRKGFEVADMIQAYYDEEHQEDMVR